MAADPARRPAADGGDPTEPRPRPVRRLASSLASAGRWVGEPSRDGRWEDLLSEFLAALLCWGGIGWLVDRWLGTEPWFLIAGIVLGNGLGIYLLWVRTEDRGTSTAGGARRDGATTDTASSRSSGDRA